MNPRPPHVLPVVCLVAFLSLAPCAFPVLAEEPEAPVGEVATEGVDLERRIVKLGDMVLFVPEVLLAALEFDELPLGSSGESLELKIERWRHPPDPPLNASGIVPRCTPPSGVYFSSGDLIEDIGRFVAQDGVVVLGTIRAVVTGWDVRAANVARMAYLDVERVLRAHSHAIDATVAPRSASRVVFATDGGEMVLDGVPVCTMDDPEQYDPVVGDRVLVAAGWWDGSGLLESGFAFRVDGEIVRADPAAVADVPLAVIQESLRQPER